jgi:regulator of protease activity HflC (stomatin/prohibitin superfamily)
MKKVLINYIYIIIATIISAIIINWFGLKISGINIGIILLAFELSHLLFSFGTVKIDEVAVLFLFGKPIDTLKPGWYFAPFGIYSVRKENGAFFQDELPAEPENIFRGDGPTPEGKFPPIRIKFGMPRNDDDDTLKNDPYNVSIVADVVPVVAWRINEPILFFEKMKTVENCRKILSDRAIAVCGDQLSTMTPAKALQNLKSISENLEIEIKETVEPWGILIKDAFLKPFNFSHGLNDAVVGVAKADLKRQETIKISEGDKKKIINEGEGKADAEEKMLLARAKGESEIKKLILEVERINLEKVIKLGETEIGQLVLWMETLKKALEKAQYSIIPGSELFTATSGIKEMLEKIKGGVK